MREPPPEGTKLCSACGRVRPHDDFYAHKGRKDGRSSRCKDCTRAERRAWRAAHPARHRDAQRRYREAHHAQRLAANRAWWDANKQWWNGQRRADHAVNPELRRAAAQRWRRANPELARLQQHNAYLRARDARLQANRDYRSGHREVVNAANRRSYARQFAVDPQKFRVRVGNRRALVRRAEGVYCKADLDLILIAQEGRCAYCGIVLVKPIHVDHMTPLNRGGSNWPANLALTCARCNLRKGTDCAGSFLARLLKETRRAGAATSPLSRAEPPL